MGTYEFYGKTTEEAIQNASQELNIPVEDLGIDIIEPGSAGIFGLVGGKRAKIRVTVKEDPNDLKDEESLSMAKEYLENILALIPVESRVTAERTDGKIALDIEGDKSGLLIGRKGKTLDALQFLVSKMVNKNLGKKTTIVVDAENYRKRREESIVQLAMKMGDKAKRMNKAVATGPMNPHERRIVHLALKEDEHLDTKSRGEGLLKKVLIIPKK